ncbi:MAG TPA: ABC transporter ATP-binding protein [Cellulomonas sp.]
MTTDASSTAPAPEAPAPRGAILEVTDLQVTFGRRTRNRDVVHAVDGVTMAVGAGETVGLVGESGSGKSTIGRVALGLLEPTAGTVRIEGADLRPGDLAQARALAQVRAVVFQDPYGSLNPNRTIGSSLAEPLEVQGMANAEARDRVSGLLDAVGLPADAIDRYPHGFSGGQRQRIAIARALATSPRLVVCDEVTSALDVITRRRVLDLLDEIRSDRDVALLFIAHDLPMVHGFADRVVVLYRGRVMESGPAAAVAHRPLHPYTRALQAAVLPVDPARAALHRTARRETVRASTAEAGVAPHAGCPFATRCPAAAPVCSTARPVDTVVGEQVVACHAYDQASGHPGPEAARHR